MASKKGQESEQTFPERGGPSGMLRYSQRRYQPRPAEAVGQHVPMQPGLSGLPAMQDFCYLRPSGLLALGRNPSQYNPLIHQHLEDTQRD